MVRALAIGARWAVRSRRLSLERACSHVRMSLAGGTGLRALEVGRDYDSDATCGC